MNDPERTGDYQPRGNDQPVALAVPATQPQHIGRYRIEKVLGQGGFGLVYLAHDDQLQRLVAIKVPHRKLVDRPEAAEAYLTEARTVANLDHPNIVPVIDVGSTEDCPCYVVSKYIDGTDLATRLKRSRLSIHEAVELVATVAEALHHAHKQGSGASGHQAGQHPARPERQTIRGGFRAGPPRAGCGQGAALRRDACLHES